jgi:hypothetical protein
LVDLLFNDPQVTMVWLSIGFSGLAAVAMYLLGRAMFGQKTGLVAGLLLASSPLFWFYGEIALPHTVDTFFVILSNWLMYEMMLGRVRAVIPAAVSLSVAGGIRQQTPVFLAPLALFAGARFLQHVGWKEGWKRIGLAVAVFGLLCAAWFFPLIGSAGGLVRYLEVTGAFLDRFDASSSLFAAGGTWGLSRNLRKLGMYTLYGWSAGTLPLAVYGMGRLRQRKLNIQWERALFFLAWVLPSLFFYALIHMGQQGLIFVYLPMLLLWSAHSLICFLQRASSATVRRVVIGALAAANVGIFVFTPEYPVVGTRVRLLTRETLINSDRYYQDRFTATERDFPVQSTVIIAANWHHVEYYLPDYALLPFDIGSKWEIDEGVPTGSPHDLVVTPVQLGVQPSSLERVIVVMFDPDLMAYNESPTSTRLLYLRHGGELPFLVLRGGQALHYGTRSFGIVDDE